MDLLSVLPYNREVVHTSVLSYLLNPERNQSAVNFANLLLDRDLHDIVAIKALPKLEVRLTKKRAMDLAVLVGRDGTDDFDLAVETKVDSAWSKSQIGESLPSDARGVLATLGRTHLAITPQDLSRDYKDWVLVGPAEMSEKIRSVAEGDVELGQYCKLLDAEADAHEAARAVARNIGATEACSAEESVIECYRGGSEPDRDALRQWAYLREVLGHRDDPWVTHWESKTLQSGPLLTLWVGESADDVYIYIEFVGQGKDLYLRVKLGRPTGQLIKARSDIVDLVGERGELAGVDLIGDPVKRPGAKRKSCSVVSYPLRDVNPIDALAGAESLRKKLLHLIGGNN